MKPIERSTIRRIVVRAANWVGDVVMGMPALDALKRNFPESHIAVLSRPWVAPLFEHHPGVDEVIPYARGQGFLKDLEERFRIIAVLRRRDFDMAFLFQNAFEAALITRLGNVPLRVGYDTDGRRCLLSHPVIREPEILLKHQVEYYLALLRALGWEAQTKEPRLHVGEREAAAARTLLLSRGIGEKDLLVGLSPGAIFGPAKRWPVDRFAAIGDRAVERWGARVVILGSEKDASACLDLAGAMRHAVVNLCGETSLGVAMGLIRELDFFLSNDSGLMHVGAALGIPTVGVFGSTNPIATGPRGRWTRVVWHDLDCAPCLRPECRIGYPCLLSIEAEEVWDAMAELQAKREEPGAEAE